MGIASLLLRLRDWYFNAELRKKQLTKLRSRANGYVLTKEQEKQIREFYAPYAKVDLAGHNYYTEKTGQFHVNYLPDDLYFTRIDAYFNDWREARYVDNKCTYRQTFHGIRQPEIVAIRCGGLWYDDSSNILTRSQLDALLAAEPEVIAKVARVSSSGQGVYFVAGKDFATIEHRFLEDIVIQRPLQQHPELAAINPTSVNTIRILSLLTQEGVKVYSSILRIGRNGTRVDNAGSGGICCGITADGKLKKYAYATKGDRYDAHPDTGLIFEGTRIPSFEKCLAAVPKLHVQIPRFHLVSWDFAIAPDGEPVFIEANMHYGGLDVHQLNNGPIFGEDTEKILKMVFGK